MSNDAHLDELGGELDRVLRTATMAVSQLGEHLARRVANQHQARAAQARQTFIDARDQARQLYLPLTYGTAADRATPAQLRQAWQAADAWAGRDPQAARAAAHLRDKLPNQNTPNTGTTSATGAMGSTQPVPVRGRSDGAVVSTDQAVALAQEHAPGYYTRHHEERREDNLQQLIADWSQWQQEGELPQRSVREEWARHVGRSEEATTARFTGGQAGYDAALEQIWNSAGSLSEQEALTLAAEHAPAYYTRHDPEVLAVDSDTAQVRADWEHWREHGQLPLRSRQEEWAAYVGRQEEFNPAQWDGDVERDAALQEVWDEGHDERGLLEMTDHLDRMDDAGMDSTPVVDSTLAADIEQFRLDAGTARATYTPLLDPAVFANADQGAAVTAWEQAAGWAGQDPAAQAAAEQLDQQFRTRWQTSPMEYLLDHLADQGANTTEDARAAHAAQTATAQRAEADELRATASELLDTEQAPDQHTAEQHSAGGHAEAEHDLHEAEQVDDDAGTAQETAPYDRTNESDMNAPGVTDEAREARQQSAAGFSRSTNDMLARHAHGKSSTSHGKPAKATIGHHAGTEHDLGR
ncbi:hypothetical protein V3G39_17945 (plasmid) [Dermatophilaceae bacterium Sec6.4]